MPFEQGRPIWVDDARFDIAYHVRLTALPTPGSREQLLALTARIQAQLLDRTRPLWELWFVEGLEGGNVGLIQKTHHALVDGVSGVDVATVLLDFTPEPTLPRAAALDRRAAAEPRPPARRHAVRADDRARGDRAHGAPPRAHAAADARAHRPARPRAGHARRPQLDRAAHVAQRQRRSPPALRGRADLARRREGDPQEPRRHGQRRRARGCRPAGCGACSSRAATTSTSRCKALCPVSVRDDSQKMQLGNRVSAMFVDLPVGETDPVERLRKIRATTEDLKEREQAVGAAFLVDLTQFAAPTLLGLAARVAHRQPFFNLVITNVPGPAGAAVLHGRADARGLPGGAADPEPRARDRDPLVLRAAPLRALRGRRRGARTSRCSRPGSRTRSRS